MLFKLPPHSPFYPPLHNPSPPTPIAITTLFLSNKKPKASRYPDLGRYFNYTAACVAVGSLPGAR